MQLVEQRVIRHTGPRCPAIDRAATTPPSRRASARHSQTAVRRSPATSLGCARTINRHSWSAPGRSWQTRYAEWVR